MTRIVDPHRVEQGEPELLDPALRPVRLDDYVGQDRIKDNLRVFIEAAAQRKEALDLLRATLKRSPWDRDVLTGLVHFSLQAGDRAEAVRYANLLRELDPESQEHAQLAQRVAATPAR